MAIQNAEQVVKNFLEHIMWEVSVKEDIRDGVVLEQKKETQDVWQVGWK